MVRSSARPSDPAPPASPPGPTPPLAERQSRAGALAQMAAPFVVALLLMVVGGAMAYQSARTRATLRGWVDHSHAVTRQLDEIETAVSTAETTQRGYLLTGDLGYLVRGRGAPGAARLALARVRELADADADQVGRLAALSVAIEQRLAIITETVRRAVAGDQASALAVVRSNRGEQLAQVITRLIAESRAHERDLLVVRLTGEAAAARRVEYSVALMMLSAVLAVGGGLLLLWREMRQTERALAASRVAEARFRTVFDHAPMGLLVVDASGAFTTVNDAFATIVGRPAASIVGVAPDDLSPVVDSPVAETSVQALLAGELTRARVETRYRRPDGDVRLATLTLSILPDLDGGAPRILGITQDVTEERRATAALHEREAQMRGAIEASLDAVLIYEVVRDSRGRLVDFEIAQCNARAARKLDIPQAELLGRRLGELVPASRERGLFALYTRVIETGDAVTHDYETDRPDLARWVRLQIVKVDDGLAVTARDITDERQNVETLRAQAHIDELTGLYNRRGFLAAAQREWQRARREGRGVSMICLDLDDFKQINDRHGHARGDDALRAMADVLRAAFRGADVVGRLGGDEFVALVVPGGPAGSTVDAATVAGQVCERIAMHLEAANAAARATGCPYTIRTSMGAASMASAAAAPDGGLPETMASLMQEADAVLYADKRRLRLTSTAAA